MNRQMVPSSVLMRLRCPRPSQSTSSHWPDNRSLLKGPSSGGWGDQERTSVPARFELISYIIQKLNLIIENKVQLKNKREHIVGRVLWTPVLLTLVFLLTHLLPVTLLLKRGTQSIMHELVGHPSRLLQSSLLRRHLLNLILQCPINYSCHTQHAKVPCK
jgi:hypothetical protein